MYILGEFRAQSVLKWETKEKMHFELQQGHLVDICSHASATAPNNPRQLGCTPPSVHQMAPLLQTMVTSCSRARARPRRLLGLRSVSRDVRRVRSGTGANYSLAGLFEEDDCLLFICTRQLERSRTWRRPGWRHTPFQVCHAFLCSHDARVLVFCLQRLKHTSVLSSIRYNDAAREVVDPRCTTELRSHVRRSGRVVVYHSVKGKKSLSTTVTKHAIGSYGLLPRRDVVRRDGRKPRTPCDLHTNLVQTDPSHTLVQIGP